VRAALEAGHGVTPVPGPSAPIAALVISGLPTDKFLYLGYLPRKSAERRKAVQEVAGLSYTLIWLEAPHRLAEALADLQAILGDRQIAVAGELTKMYEEVFRAPLSAAQAHFAEYPARGEFTLVVAGNDGAGQAWSREQMQAELESLLASGERPSEIARSVAAASGWPRSEVYDLLTGLKQQ
jgi:16S rRNA (cytidine1402-2'-O)-methyltransferase